MPRLDDRLKQVAKWIHGATHADIGCDHGHLPAALLAAGRIQFAIAIDNKPIPLSHARQTLARLGQKRGWDQVPASIRLGNGLDPVAAGELDSLSICGMGGSMIAKILSQHPDRVPTRVVVQPNKLPERVRQWALDGKYRISDETAVGRLRHRVLSFVKHTVASEPFIDPAYNGLDFEAAILFGPLNLRRREPAFIDELRNHRRYLLDLPAMAARVAAIDRVLAAPSPPPPPQP